MERERERGRFAGWKREVVWEIGKRGRARWKGKERRRGERMRGRGGERKKVVNAVVTERDSNIDEEEGDKQKKGTI